MLKFCDRSSTRQRLRSNDFIATGHHLCSGTRNCATASVYDALGMNPALTPGNQGTRERGNQGTRNHNIDGAKDRVMTIRAITFDVYSALYDAVSGLQRALAALLQARGTAGDPAALARTWRQRHMEYLLIANSLEREPARNRTALDASARQTRGAPPPS